MEAEGKTKYHPLFCNKQNRGKRIYSRDKRYARDKASATRTIEIENFLLKNGIDISIMNISTLGEALSDKGLIAENRGRGFKRKEFNSGFSSNGFDFANLSDLELYHEAANLDCSTSPFKASTIKNAVVLVDSREPYELFQELKKTKLNNVSTGVLQDGDILITNGGEPSKVLLIERKSLTDLYSNIVSDSKHAHEQAERYYRRKIEYKEMGIDLQVIWIIEGEMNKDGNVRTLYNLLPQVKQVDGWLNYLVSICQQYVLTSYNTNHTAYITSKLVQGFCEKALYYPVKVGARRVDMSGSERKSLSGAFKVETEEVGHRNVVSVHDGISGVLATMPGISTSIAKQLSETKKSLAEIFQMTEVELIEIKGIGKKKAREIFTLFNMKE